MSDIFISYAREDQPRARILADTLESKGWSVWWDPRIRSGEAFDRIIETALSDARCVVVLWSQRSVGSDWVRAEASNGLSRGILISVLIDKGVTLPLRFSQVQTEQLSDWDGTNTSPVLQKLMTDIAVILGPPGSTTQERLYGSQSETATNPTAADRVSPHQAQSQDKPSRDNAPLYSQQGSKPTRQEKELSYWKAVGCHLLLGFGLYYVDRDPDRRWLYPICVSSYAILGCILASANIQPFADNTFGAITVFVSFAVYAYSFVDVVRTCRTRRKNVVGGGHNG
jgi:hypothetical protein